VPLTALAELDTDSLRSADSDETVR
jgi:hypothetical protein